MTHPRIFWRNALFLLLAFWLASSQAFAAPAGHVEAMGGEVTRLDAKGQGITAKQGLPIEVGDTLYTGASGWAVLAMSDGASLTLKANTRLRIDAYLLDREKPQESKAWLNLAHGALRSISGLIGKTNKPGYKLSTPDANIGIRGTDHEAYVALSATADADVGTYDLVYGGETVLQNPAGEVYVLPGQTARVSGLSLPVLLGAPPPIFAKLREFATRNGLDKVLERLHERDGEGFRARLSEAMQDKPELRETLRTEMREAIESGSVPDDVKARTIKRAIIKRKSTP